MSCWPISAALRAVPPKQPDVWDRSELLRSELHAAEPAIAVPCVKAARMQWRSASGCS